MKKTDLTSKKVKPNLTYLRDKDREKVKGIFRYYEVSGGSVSFSFRAHKGDSIDRYDFIDGQIYTVPLAVARHLNNNCWYPRYEHIPGEDDVIGGVSPNGLGKGMQGMRISKKVRRMGFQSLEFTDVEELNTPDKEIVNVEFTEDAR